MSFQNVLFSSQFIIDHTIIIFHIYNVCMEIIFPLELLNICAEYFGHCKLGADNNLQKRNRLIVVISLHAIVLVTM